MKKINLKQLIYGFIFIIGGIFIIAIISNFFLNVFITPTNAPGIDETYAQSTTETQESNQQDTETSFTDNSSTEYPVEENVPDVSPEDWNLVLVGPYNEIAQEVSEDQLSVLSGSYQVDNRIVDAYNQLATAAEAAGHPLVIVSAFRSVAYQQEVFDTSVNRRVNEENIPYEQAVAEASEQVTQPGFSEHHTGLAVDVVDADWYNNYSAVASDLLDQAYGEQPGAQWLAENCAQYGFIIRYLDGREDITGITYEPWHLRYVGVESAEYIMSHNLTLEEYLALLN